MWQSAVWRQDIPPALMEYYNITTATCMFRVDKLTIIHLCRLTFPIQFLFNTIFNCSIHTHTHIHSQVNSQQHYRWPCPQLGGRWSSLWRLTWSRRPGRCPAVAVSLYNRTPHLETRQDGGVWTAAHFTHHSKRLYSSCYKVLFFKTPYQWFYTQILWYAKFKVDICVSSCYYTMKMKDLSWLKSCLISNISNTLSALFFTVVIFIIW